jgi:hypothetical protein
VESGESQAPVPRPEASKAYRVQVQELAPSVAPESSRAAEEAVDPHERGLFMGGPRVGMTYVSGDGYEKLRKSVRDSKPGADVDPYMTHFGWQLEYRIFKTDKGLTALTEVIPVVMAMDQGLALPSVNWLIGVRGKNGFEMGVGPNLGLGGVSMVAGTGFTFDLGGINVPVNLAVGLGSKTTSTSLSIGFNL